MPAGDASSCALPRPLVRRPVSCQSRLETLVFPGNTLCFVVEGVGLELGRLVRKRGKEENSLNQSIDRSTGFLIQAYLRLFGIQARGIEC